MSFGLIQIFFFISLAIVLGLILLLCYYLKNKIDALEKQAGSFRDILGNLIREIKHHFMEHESLRPIQAESGPIQVDSIFKEEEMSHQVKTDTTTTTPETEQEVVIDIDEGEYQDEEDEEDKDEDDEEEIPNQQERGLFPDSMLFFSIQPNDTEDVVFENIHLEEFRDFQDFQDFQQFVPETPFETDSGIVVELKEEPPFPVQEIELQNPVEATLNTPLEETKTETETMIVELEFAIEPETEPGPEPIAESKTEHESTPYTEVIAESKTEPENYSYLPVAPESETMTEDKISEMNYDEFSLEEGGLEKPIRKMNLQQLRHYALVHKWIVHGQKMKKEDLIRLIEEKQSSV